MQRAKIVWVGFIVVLVAILALAACEPKGGSPTTRAGASGARPAVKVGSEPMRGLAAAALRPSWQRPPPPQASPAR